jgi:hypothetical protein
MYMGDNIEAIPTPIPPRSLDEIRNEWPGAIMHPRADRKNSKADSSRDIFLPNLSLRKPAPATPATHPTSAELTYHPSVIEFNVNCSLTKLSVPEIMAVSYPNRKPPVAAIREINMRYAVEPPDFFDIRIKF